LESKVQGRERGKSVKMAWNGPGLIARWVISCASNKAAKHGANIDEGQRLRARREKKGNWSKMRVYRDFMEKELTDFTPW